MFESAQLSNACSYVVLPQPVGPMITLIPGFMIPLKNKKKWNNE